MLSASLCRELLSWHAAALAENGWKAAETLDAASHAADRRLLVCPIIVRGNNVRMIAVIIGKTSFFSAGIKPQRKDPSEHALSSGHYYERLQVR
jgi:hypothetical protein